MSDKSSIEWTDAKWNPIRGSKGRHHCVRISEGCKHCYASTMNHRFGGPDYVKGADTPRLDEDALLQPLKWKRPRRIFVCSMTDLFMDEHTDEMINRVFAVMALSPHHTFQVLTKRSRRMKEWFLGQVGLEDRKDDVQHCAAHHGRIVWDSRGSDIRNYSTVTLKGNVSNRRPWPGWPLPNVWLGVSAENQQRADERIPDLLATPAAVRFVSAEPLLGPIHLDNGETLWLSCQSKVTQEQYEAMSAKEQCDHHCCESFDMRGEHYRGIDWVIAGGESGPGARPCDVQWIRSIKDQCQASSVACFVKQVGSKPIHFDPRHEWFDGANFHTGGNRLMRLKDRKGGDPAEWPEDLRVRQMPGER